ncbi:hypothetical protein, partial [Streptomyces lacrimifluminis]
AFLKSATARAVAFRYSGSQAASMAVILTWATAHPTVSARGCGGSVERWHGCGDIAGVAEEQEGDGGGDPVGFADALQAEAASEGRSVMVQLVGRPTAEAVG